MWDNNVCAQLDDALTRAHEAILYPFCSCFWRVSSALLAMRRIALPDIARSPAFSGKTFIAASVSVLSSVPSCEPLARFPLN